MELWAVFLLRSSEEEQQLSDGDSRSDNDNDSNHGDDDRLDLASLHLSDSLYDYISSLQSM